MITLKLLRMAGATPEFIAKVAELEQEERILARREQNRINQRNFRKANKINDDVIHVSADSADSADQRKRKERKEPKERKEKETTSSPSGSSVGRGSRLGTDWQPTAADLDFAKSRGLIGTFLEDEIIKFRNHWLSKSGQNATKCSWTRTWQNWVINAGKPKGAMNGHRHPGRKTMADVLAEMRERESPDLFGMLPRE